MSAESMDDDMVEGRERSELGKRNEQKAIGHKLDFPLSI